MSKVRVAAFGISADGFGAGPDQSLENPLGVGGTGLHEWFLPTRTFRAMFGQADGTTGVDEDFAARSMANVGAWIMGRNMFTPARGAWEFGWKGWWGPNPPYHVPVFVLTHHARPPLAMEGGTVFHFETDGIHAALDKARKAAGEKDVRIGGGPSTVRQYVQAGLVDELHVSVAPTLLGAGEPLFAGADWVKLGYRVAESTMTEKAMHLIIRK